MADITLCPRCAHETIEKLAASPVAGAWDVLQCQRCLYMWRTSEPARRTERGAYPNAFRLTQADIDNAPEMPVIPPLRMDA
jgi:vanillate/4-hydroxybenzoate decarboxylase subunit D